MPSSLAKPLTTFEFTWTCLGSGAWLTAVVPGAASKVMVDCVHSPAGGNARPASGAHLPAPWMPTGPQSTHRPSSFYFAVQGYTYL